MNGLGTNTIETNRLILRRMELSDAPFIFKNWASDEETTKFLDWNAHPSEEASLKYAEFKVNRYQNDFNFDWVIVLKDTHEVIGEIDAVNVNKDHKTISIGYVLSRKYWQQGYMTEALKGVIDYLFNLVGTDQITACHIPENPASGRVMEKAGMKYNATIKNYRINKVTGKRTDLIYYSIEK